jgi:hypothetical protein
MARNGRGSLAWLMLDIGPQSLVVASLIGVAQSGESEDTQKGVLRPSHHFGIR